MRSPAVSGVASFDDPALGRLFVEARRDEERARAAGALIALADAASDAGAAEARRPESLRACALFFFASREGMFLNASVNSSFFWKMLCNVVRRFGPARCSDARATLSVVALSSAASKTLTSSPISSAEDLEKFSRNITALVKFAKQYPASAISKSSGS